MQFTHRYKTLIVASSIILGSFAFPTYGIMTAKPQPPVLASQKSPIEKKTQRLMDLMEVRSLLTQTFDQLIAQKKAMGEDQAFLTEFQKQLNINEIVDPLALTYAKYLSENDIDELIKFYESPLGRRYNDAMPKIQRDLITHLQTYLETTLNQAKRKAEQQKGKMK